MNKRKLLITVRFMFIFLMVIFFAGPGLINAQEHQVIRINSYGEEIYLEPKIVSIPKGTVVVWINWVRLKEVQVVFEEGKKCEDVTEAPTGFQMDAQNCYVTSYIAYGRTSSLKFNEEGTFEYEVRTAKGQVKARGRIIIK